MKQAFFFVIIINLFLLSSCELGPDYVRPPTEIPEKYKEATEGWKVAEPQDQIDRGTWWKIFNNPELNALEAQVNVCNQNIAAVQGQYDQARALVSEAVAALFPTLSGSVSATREKFSNGAGTTFGNAPVNDFFMGLSAMWEPDLWGSVRRNIESNVANAQSIAALVASTRLSVQATLAQDYFQLRALDMDQKILDDTVIADRKALQLTQNKFRAGTASLADVASATTQLKTVQALAIDNHIARQLFEHAIAVLIGIPPAEFTLKPKLMVLIPPRIPVQVPSALLERRPDVAQAERQAAAANAQIGVAIAAFFPTLTLTGTIGFESRHLQTLFSKPALFWSYGAALAETIYDAGLRWAQVQAANAVYRQNVALYRQAVLVAFQDVEDNLVTLRVLNHEIVVQDQAVAAARTALRLLLAEYKAGTAAYTDVIVAQTNLLNLEKTRSDLLGRRMVAAVGLIKALGGGWDVCTDMCFQEPERLLHI